MDNTNLVSKWEFCDTPNGSAIVIKFAKSSSIILMDEPSQKERRRSTRWIAKLIDDPTYITELTISEILETYKYNFSKKKKCSCTIYFWGFESFLHFKTLYLHFYQSLGFGISYCKILASISTFENRISLAYSNEKHWW